MPAQRFKKILKPKRTSKARKLFCFRKILAVLLAFFVLAAVGLFGCKSFSGSRKLTLVINTSLGEAVVSTFDSSANEISSLTIPANTQIKASRQLGLWKVKSLWQLGSDEKLEGKLLQESIVKNFHIPATHWASQTALGFSSGKLVPLLKAVFLPYKSNLGFWLKIKLAAASLKTTNLNRPAVNLAETQFLKKTKLQDGEMGYLVSENFPSELFILFSEETDKRGGWRVHIEDVTGRAGIADEIGETVEVLGAKISSVSKGAPEKFDCSVSGKDEFLVSKVARIFSCKKESRKTTANFDLEIKLGEDFAKRF